jgi:hypothetical protein
MTLTIATHDITIIIIIVTFFLHLKNESCSVECHSVECHSVECHLLNVILLNVILLNVILLNVILLNVILLNVILLNVILLNVIQPEVSDKIDFLKLNLISFSSHWWSDSHSGFT